MKRWFLILLAGCAIEDQLSQIRPGANYILHSGNYEGIEWVDKSQTKPTAQELAQAETDCQALISQKFTVKQQAITDAKNTGKTTNERLDALIKAVGF